MKSATRYLPGLHVIYRPKLSGTGLHYGVMLVGNDGLPQGVRHFGRAGWEATMTLDEFAQGRPVGFESHVRLDPDARQRWVAVSLGGVRVEYDLLNSNCEHQANWLAFGRVASSQAIALSIVMGIGAFFAVAYLLNQLDRSPPARA